ncbi:MAG: hypothetical protein Q9174_002418 [Haloplaca sp. 1 TL-2023]
MTIDLVDNREVYEDVYPSESEDEESDDATSSESEDESPTIENLNSQIQKLELSIKEAAEERNSAQGRMDMLNNYARSLSASRPDDIAKCVEAYRSERLKAFGDHKNGEATIKREEDQIAKLKTRRLREIQKLASQKAKTNRAEARESKIKLREKQLKAAEERRIKQERLRFWPTKVYKVVLCLDANSGLTPASSRRGSVNSVERSNQQQLPVDSKSANSCNVNLTFSYVTSSASWSPRYDLSLDTASNSGSITYRAEFRNTTSETWRNTEVVLSTSQTSFQGLGEPIPEIQPWRIRLASGFGDYAKDNALYSSDEQFNKSNTRNIFNQKPQLPRSQLFGIAESNKKPLWGNSVPVPPPPASSGFGALGRAGQSANGSLFGAPNNINQRSGGGGLFGSATAAQPAGASSLFGSANPTRQQAQAPASTFEPATSGFQAQPNIMAPRSREAPAILADEDDADLDTDTIAPGGAELAFQESTWEETGLTSTYTVPGTKTISPSHNTRRYKVASIPLSDVTLSHFIIPKLRSAAYLKARIRNSSSTTLLKGAAGLTLDGTFLGNTSLPRSSPGEAFTLNLGVDPALNVIYSKPTVRRSQSGMFQKEGNCIYSRSCTLTNTKNNASIEATVLDQVPMSEDDKLKIEVLTPRGLSKEGDQVAKAGVGQINEGTGKKGSTYAENNTGGKGKKEWGKASAKMRKQGEIEWDVKLNPGQGVKLELEYEARFPSGSGIMAV